MPVRNKPNQPKKRRSSALREDKPALEVPAIPGSKLLLNSPNPTSAATPRSLLRLTTPRKLLDRKTSTRRAISSSSQATLAIAE